MNSEFNDMERMFADGLRNYEVTPPAHIWSNIQKRKRKGLFYYNWKVASALLLLCLTGGATYYFTHENNKADQIEISAKLSTGKSPEKFDISNSEKPIIAADNSEKVKISKEPTIITSISKTKGEKVKKQTSKVENDNSDIPVEEYSKYNTEDMIINIESKERIHLKYLIYPSLTRYVYSSKKLFTKEYKQKVKDKEDKKMTYKYSIELPLVGASYSFRKLSGAGDELRSESENAVLSLQTGIKLNYHFNPTWSVQTGLTLENRNEKLKYNRTEIQTILSETPRQVIVYHPVLPPRIITVIDSTYTDKNVEYKFNSINKYYTLNIPLVLGYNFTLGKLQYRFSAGPLFNIYSISRANNLARIGNEIVLVPYKESPKIKTSVYSAVAMQYPINNHYNLFTEISYYANLSNRLNSDAIIQQRNFGINLSGGIKFNLIK